MITILFSYALKQQQSKKRYSSKSKRIIRTLIFCVISFVMLTAFQNCGKDSEYANKKRADLRAKHGLKIETPENPIDRLKIQREEIKSESTAEVDQDSELAIDNKQENVAIEEAEAAEKKEVESSDSTTALDEEVSADKSATTTDSQGVCPSHAGDRTAIQALADEFDAEWSSYNDPQAGHYGYFREQEGYFECDSSGSRVTYLSPNYDFSPEKLYLLRPFSELTALDLSTTAPDLNILVNFVKLQSLYVSTKGREIDGSFSNISALSNLLQLTRLTIQGLNVQNLNALRNARQLKSVVIYDSENLRDISGLANSTQLENLTINYGENQISDITVLSRLTALKELELSGNNIASIAALSGLTQLKKLYLYNNLINNIDALSNLRQLEDLGLGINSIRDISALRALTELKYLDLQDNRIRDIAALSGLTNLEVLVLEKNNIQDIQPITTLSKLDGLSLAENNISVVPDSIINLTKLYSINLSHNRIETINPALGQLEELYSLNLSNNLISDFYPREIFNHRYYNYMNFSNNFFCGFYTSNYIFNFDNNTPGADCYNQEKSVIKINGNYFNNFVQQAPIHIRAGDNLVGEVAHLYANNAQSCAEVGSATHCQGTNAQFVDMPNADWSYDHASKLWKTNMRTYSTWENLDVRLYFKNKTTGRVSNPFLIKFTK